MTAVNKKSDMDNMPEYDCFWNNQTETGCVTFLKTPLFLFVGMP